MTPGLGPTVISRMPGFWPFLMRWGLHDKSIWVPGEVEHYAQHVAHPARARATSQLRRESSEVSARRGPLQSCSGKAARTPS